MRKPNKITAANAGWRTQFGSLAAMRTRSRVLIVLLISLAGGCYHQSDLELKLEAAGGAEMLKREAETFTRLYSQTAGYQSMWTPRDTNFPPAIASLQPLSIRVRRQQKVSILDILVTNGPPQRGVMVAIGRRPLVFRPTFGTNWVVQKIGDGVYEYHD